MIAIARSFLRPASIILLDESTSSMDSWPETAWMKRFRQLAKERTAILITQRFTTTMHTYRIFVMDQGRIVESGTLYELIDQNGLYAQDWAA